MDWLLKLPTQHLLAVFHTTAAAMDNAYGNDLADLDTVTINIATELRRRETTREAKQ
jgi:hypothetical protein